MVLGAQYSVLDEALQTCRGSLTVTAVACNASPVENCHSMMELPGNFEMEPANNGICWHTLEPTYPPQNELAKVYVELRPVSCPHRCFLISFQRCLPPRLRAAVLIYPKEGVDYTWTCGRTPVCCSHCKPQRKKSETGEHASALFNKGLSTGDNVQNTMFSKVLAAALKSHLRTLERFSNNQRKNPSAKKL